MELSLTPRSEDLSKIKEKLYAPRPKIPVIISRVMKGLFSFNKCKKFFLNSLATALVITSLTKKIRIINAIAPGIRKNEDIPDI